MSTAYDMLGIGMNATRAELDAVYAAKFAAYDPARVAEFGVDMVQLAQQRRVELARAYASLCTALAAPLHLDPAIERRRDRNTMWTLLALLAIALLVPLLRGIAVPERSVAAINGSEAAMHVNTPAPEFQLAALDGKDVRLSDYKGKVVLVNFWATWCPSCIRETPGMVRLYNQYRDQGFEILGVNVTFEDDQAKVAAYTRDQNIAYPILLDTTGAVGQAYGDRLLPGNYLIDRAGKLVYTRIGELDETQMAEQVKTLLAQPVDNTQ